MSPVCGKAGHRVYDENLGKPAAQGRLRSAGEQGAIDRWRRGCTGIRNIADLLPLREASTSMAPRLLSRFP
jgi:hypothetical protein